VTGQILSGQTEDEFVHGLSAAIEKYLGSPDLLDQHKRSAYQHFLSRDFNQDAVAARFCRLLGVEA
jgi:hypothetical protein